MIAKTQSNPLDLCSWNLPFGFRAGLERETRIAHRGDHEHYPENSLLAFSAFGGVSECDVRFSKDRSLVVHHDPNLDRTTNSTGRVKDYTIAELRRIRLVHKGSETSQVMPTLEEALALGCPLMIELKGPFPLIPDRRLVKAAINLLQQQDVAGRVALSSFSPWDLRLVKHLAPEFHTSLLVGAEQGYIGPYRQVSRAMWRVLRSTSQIDSFAVHKSLLESPQTIDRARFISVRFGWTVVNTKELTDCRDAGVVPIADPLGKKRV